MVFFWAPVAGRDEPAGHATSVVGTKRTWRDVRLESVVRAKADIAASLLFRHAGNMPRQFLLVTPNRVFQ